MGGCRHAFGVEKVWKKGGMIRSGPCPSPPTTPRYQTIIEGLFGLLDSIHFLHLPLVDNTVHTSLAAH
jgi:hypothetical protein